VSDAAAGPIAEAAAAALRGELVVLPTDTVYGIGTRPDDPAATAKLFAAKRRPAELTLPVLVAARAEAREVAVFDERAERIVAGTWPGAVTIVLPRTPATHAWRLGADLDTIGVRMPAHPLALALLARTGPLAVTSANLSGLAPARSCDALVEAFGELVSVYLCSDEPLGGAASTVVDLTGREPAILRDGDVAAEEIVRLSAAEGPLLDSGPA
jgi:tRNA threonylcarbamoyl adenosine modification protein (Sua5/YciO/YrdC/YwlC family)